MAMTMIKHTLAEVATLLRDIQQTGTVPPEISQRINTMGVAIARTGRAIIDQEYPQADHPVRERKE